MNISDFFEGAHAPARVGLSIAPWLAFAAALTLLLAGTFWSAGLMAQSLNKRPGWPGTTVAGAPCWGKPSTARFEYLRDQSRLAIVEDYHFFRQVQQLALTDEQLSSNLDYTLRWIPNHHRALWLKAKHYLRMLGNENKRQALHSMELHKEGDPPPECYFQRATVFNPADGMVPAIFGIYLHRREMYDAALAQYDLSESVLPNNSEVIYNKGLLYFDMGQFDKAREYADKARELGYPLKGLQRKLDTAVAAGAVTTSDSSNKDAAHKD